MKKLGLPPGFQFNPSDQDLISYLKLKAKGISFRPWNNVVIERNLYSQDAITPWMLFTDEDPWQTTITKVDAAAGKINVERIVFVVTKLVKIGNKKTLRSVGCWTWDGATGQSNIWDLNGQIVGFKKMLNLRGKKGMEIVGNWIMHEYHLSGVSLEEVDKNQDYVICRIKWDYSTNIINKVQKTDGVVKLGKRKPTTSDQRIPMEKRVCSRGSKINGVNQGNVMEERSLILGTEAQEREAFSENSCELEGVSNQENSIVTGVSSSYRNSINSSRENSADLDCCCGGIGNPEGELDIVRLSQEDDLYLDLGDIIDVDDFYVLLNG